MPTFEYTDHPHLEARKKRGPAVTKHHASVQHRLTLNERIGLVITRSIGTMWAAYIFLGLTLVSLPAALASENVIIIVAWIAQTFLQLVLLPIIIVGQNIQAKSSDERAIATYEDAGAILEEARHIQSHLSVQDEALNQLITRLEKLENKLESALERAGK